MTVFNPMRAILAITASGLVASSAMAADGTINFTGEISSVSCSITAGGGTGGGGAQTITVPLGKVSIDSIKTPAEGTIASTVRINLNLDCGSTGSGLSTVDMKFDPAAGSGIDLKDPRLLKTLGAGKGVGIAIYNENNQIINMSANEIISGTLTQSPPSTGTYKSSISLRAGYVANAEDFVAGKADGTLPFSLTYK
ncbi:fimbrial protein [Pseudomonas sp. NFPP19]|uniref:fimbrial protein n=1 Tax=Pseudomonas sp. NFPP19 TaxID=1566225 RepID=UPI00195DA87A|nr:fimbrial protein [Pseudomonas sp. NFPP19]